MEYGFAKGLTVFCGGKGINKARNNGYNGNWTIKEGKEWFNRQAVFTIIGVITFCLLFFSGTNKNSELEKSQIETNRLLLEQINQTNALVKELTQERIEKKIYLEKRISEIKDSLKSNQTKKK